MTEESKGSTEISIYHENIEMKNEEEKKFLEQKPIPLIRDLQSELYQHVLFNDLEGINNIIELDSKVLTRKYYCSVTEKFEMQEKKLFGHLIELPHNSQPENYYERTILQIACEHEAIKKETIELLIESNQKLLSIFSKESGFNSYHCAARSGNIIALETLIDKDPQKINIYKRSIFNRDTCLTIAIKSILLNKTVGELDENKTERFLNCVKILIDKEFEKHKKNIQLKIPIYWAIKGELKDVCKIIFQGLKNYMDMFKESTLLEDILDEIYENNKTVWEVLLETVFRDIELNECFKFCSNVNEDLYACLRLGHEQKFIDIHTLNTESTENMSYSKYNYLQYACFANFHQVVIYLLKTDPYKLNPNKKKFGISPIELATKRGNYVIVRLLLSNPHIEIPNDFLIKMASCSTIGNAEFVKCLLKLGININYSGGKDNNSALHCSALYGNEEMTLELLRCGASLASKNNCGRMAIELIENRILEKHFNECIEYDNGININDPKQKVRFNFSTFLLKTHQNRKSLNQTYFTEKEFTENTRKYIKEHSSLNPETEILKVMCRDKKMIQFLKHPLIMSLINIKYYKITSFFFVNLILYSLFCISLFSYLYCKEKPYRMGLYVFLLIMYIIFLLREIFEICVSPHTYLTYIENYFQVAIAVLVPFVLLHNDPDILFNCDKCTKALLIMFCSFEFFFFIGKHPKICINIALLKKVTENFFQILLWYSFLIVGFAMSFYILFGHQKDFFFTTPFISFFQTILMMTGELGGIIEQFQKVYEIGHFFLLLFVFVITIILFNLLNGLAVTDIQRIRDEAHINATKFIIEYISYIETATRHLTLIMAKYCNSRWNISKYIYLDSKSPFYCINIKTQNRLYKVPNLNDEIIEYTRERLERMIK